MAMRATDPLKYPAKEPPHAGHRSGISRRNARAHLDEAEKIAARIGKRNSMRTYFGPTNVAVWRYGAQRAVEAIRHPDTADRLAPTRIRNDPIARDLLSSLDQRDRTVCTMRRACLRVTVGSTTGPALRQQHEPIVLGEVEEVLRVEGCEWQLPGQAARGDPRVVDGSWPAAKLGVRLKLTPA